MKLVGVSFVILSLCIILGQSKPRGHPKKCISASDCKPGYACKFIKKLGFKLCAKPKHDVESNRFRTGKKSRKQKNKGGRPIPQAIAEDLSPGPDPEGPLRDEGGSLGGGGSPPVETDYLEEGESNGAPGGAPEGAPGGAPGGALGTFF